jgi:hypothetical protein
MVVCTQSAGEHREKPLRASHDAVEHATDRTSSEAIAKAADSHGVESTICRWICSMLGCRNITATLLGETVQGSVTRSVHGKALSPLLWSLVVDKFFWEFNKDYYYAVGCVDDIAIQINGKFHQTVSEVIQTALGTGQQW